MLDRYPELRGMYDENDHNTEVLYFQNMTATIYLWLGTWEIIAIVAVILLLFGGAKIPELMRGLGKGVKEFKKAQKEVEDAIQEEPEEAKKDEKKPE